MRTLFFCFFLACSGAVSNAAPMQLVVVGPTRQHNKADGDAEAFVDPDRAPDDPPGVGPISNMTGFGPTANVTTRTVSASNAGFTATAWSQAISSSWIFGTTSKDITSLLVLSGHTEIDSPMPMPGVIPSNHAKANANASSFADTKYEIDKVAHPINAGPYQLTGVFDIVITYDGPAAKELVFNSDCGKSSITGFYDVAAGGWIIFYSLHQSTPADPTALPIIRGERNPELVGGSDLVLCKEYCQSLHYSDQIITKSQITNTELCLIAQLGVSGGDSEQDANLDAANSVRFQVAD